MRTILENEIAREVVNNDEFVENAGLSRLSELPALSSWMKVRQGVEKDSPREYLFVENVGILGVCIVGIFNRVFEICVNKFEEKRMTHRLLECALRYFLDTLPAHIAIMLETVSSPASELLHREHSQPVGPPYKSIAKIRTTTPQINPCTAFLVRRA